MISGLSTVKLSRQPMFTIFSYPSVPTDVNLTNKSAIVTGSNTGIGLEIARHLFRLGANVTIACRNQEKALKAIENIKTSTVYFTGGTLEFQKLDLENLDSVREFASKFTKKPIHILINNAGLINTDNIKTANGIDLTIQVNHLGPFLLTNLLLPSLKLSFEKTKVHSRVVFVSSGAHYFPSSVPFDDFLGKSILPNGGLTQSFTQYGLSKLYNVINASELAKTEYSNGVFCASVHPGFVNSEFGSRGSGLLTTFAGVLSNFMARSTAVGATTALYAALSLESSIGNSGVYLDSDGKVKKASSFALDPEVCKKVWSLSEEAVKIAVKV